MDGAPVVMTSRRRMSPRRQGADPVASVVVNDERQSEKQFQARVVELARILGYSIYHTHDSRRSEPGFPDLVLVRPPRVLFVELKAGRRRLTDDQAAWMALLERCDQVDAFTLRGRLDGADDLGAFERVLVTRSTKET